MHSTLLLNSLVEGINEALMSWTVAGEIATWNKAAERLLGYRAEEMLGRNSAVLVPADLLAEHHNLSARLVEQASASIATQRRHAQGELVHVQMSLSRLGRCGEIVGIGCMLRPLDEDARHLEELRQRACTDALTGVLNRAGMEESMSCGYVPGDGYRAVLFIDLDGFKRVNDEAGHSQGDEVLMQCVRRIRECLPDAHTLGRWGGDEFVVVLEQLSPDYQRARHEAEWVYRKLQAAMDPHYQVSTRRHYCPASIGACLYHPSLARAGEALELADRAMYRAKAARTLTRLADAC